MVMQYNEIVEFISSDLTGIEFELMHKAELCVVFRKENMFVIVEGERHIEGAFGLFVAPSWPCAPDKMHMINIIMMAVGDKRVPSLINQMDFLKNNMDMLFNRPEEYRAEYKKINECW